MKKNIKIIAMIPARLGSVRLPMKNLALLGGKPLIFYAINAAKESDIFDDIFLNSENMLFKKIADRYDIEFYKRPNRLAISGAKSDFVVYDFIKKNPCDIVAWINPTSPLQTGDEIKKVVNYFLDNNLDSLITVKNEQVHCVYKNKPVNFRLKEVFAKTQELTPVNPFVYSVMMWRARIFQSEFEKKGRAFFCGKTGYYAASKISSFIIKKEEDLMMAELLLKIMKNRSGYRVAYDKVLKML